MVIEDTLYSKVHLILDKFYPLLKSVVDNDFVHSHFEEYFSKDLVQEISKVNDLFLASRKTRTCGNPAFTHSLRVLLWLNILGADEKTLQLSLYHDLLEDLSSSLDAMEKEYYLLPEDLRDDVFYLTNVQSDVVKTLERSDVLVSDNSLLEDLSKKPLFSSVVENIVDELGRSSLSAVKKKSYRCYLNSLLSYLEESNTDRALLVKLADRLDNTLADWPSKFPSIIKIYSKNELVLSTFKDFVLKSDNNLLKLFFVLLIERSLDQIAFLIKNYSIISEKRGVFYGEQYKKLLDQLRAEEEKLLPFKEVREEILKTSSVENYVADLLRKEK